jgi:hypothetical protein
MPVNINNEQFQCLLRSGCLRQICTAYRIERQYINQSFGAVILF